MAERKRLLKRSFLVYVGNQNNSTVSVINSASNRVIKTIPVGKNPGQVNASPDGRQIYAINGGDRSISILSTRTNQVTRTIRNVSPEPFAAVSVGNRFYVPDLYTGGVTVFNALTNGSIARFPVANLPLAIAASPDGKKLYVTTQARNIWIIDTRLNRVVNSIPTGATWGLDFTPDGKKFVVNSFGTNETLIYCVRTNKIINSIPVGVAPIDINVSRDGRRAYVANSRSRSVSVIDLKAKRVIKTIQVGDVPYNLAITPDDRSVYVTNNGSNTVSVIDARTLKVLLTIPVGLGPRGIAII
ncbi:40-residue YVTN family beta-propeller repeat-containing protein [Paenibacillaceae bacterium GAS479]|nr:40-residue YVTN family beta-propeller repeat-containing protein [Paenibacillaceae bacterium GAS479]